jgi:hypothetical protein
MAETILFRLVAQDAGVNAAIVSNREEIKKLNKEIAAAKGTNGYADLVRNLTDAKVKAAELKAEQRALNREFQATQVPKDSLAGLRLEYSKLTEQITKLSATERNSDFGKGLVSSAAKIKKEVDGIEQSVGRFTGNVGNYKSALSGVFGLFAAAGVSFGVGEIIQAARETEKLFAVLTNAVGSKSGATRIFAELQDFAATTPFALNEVVGAFTKLEQRNFNPNIEQLRTLGDIAAASGKSLDQFVEAVLDAQTGEFERLKEFGIVARKNGDQLSVSFKGQTTSIKNTSESITEYLLGLGKLPGIQGATDAVAKTLDGSLSNLADNFSRLFATIGSGGGILKSLVDGFSGLIGSVNELLSIPLSESIRQEQQDFNSLIGVLKDVNITQDTRTRAIAELQQNYPEYIGNIDLNKASEEQLNGILVQGNQLFEKRIFLQGNEEKLTEFAKKRIALQKELFEAEKAQQQNAGSKSVGRQFDFESKGVGGVTDKQAADAFAGAVDSRKKSLAELDKEQSDFVKNQEDFAKKIFGSTDGAEEFAKTEEEKRKIAAEKEKKRLKELAEAAGKSGKEQANAYELVKKRIDELSESLQVAVTTNNQGAIPKILGDLTKAQTELQIIDATVARIKSGATNDNRSIAQRVRNPLSDTAPAPGSDLGSDPVSAELDRAKFANAEIVDDKERTNQELLQLQSELSEGNLAALKKGLDDEKAAKEQALEEDRQRRQQLTDLAIESVGSIAGAVLQIEKNRIESQKETAITALDEEYQKRLDAAQGNTVLQEKIQKEFDAKKLAIEKKAAKQRQDLAVKEAIVQGALAVIKALATGNFATAIAAGVATLAQIAIIKKEKFERGGVVKFGKFGGKPHSQGGTKGYFEDGTNVEVEKDEVFAVVNKRNAPMLQKLSAVNAYGGHGTRFFEKGGALNFTPQIALPQQTALVQVLPSEATFSDAQSAQIGEIAGREMAKILAPVLQNSVALGINDSNRRLERENDLLTNRTV